MNEVTRIICEKQYNDRSECEHTVIVRGIEEDKNESINIYQCESGNKTCTRDILITLFLVIIVVCTLVLAAIFISEYRVANKSSSCQTYFQCTAAKYKLTWSDEFNYSGPPDPNKWTYDIGNSGWGNGELEYYTDNITNAFVEDGKLNIVAIFEQYSAPNITNDENIYTSARLVTTKNTTLKYGRIEISSKLPIVNGTWSAFWLFGIGNSYSEIDIMENVGYEPQLVWFSTHSEPEHRDPNAHQTASITIKNTSTAYHLYAIEWTPDHIFGFVDDVRYFSLYKNNTDPKYWHFDDEMLLVLNLAIGGDWGGGWSGYDGVNSSLYPQTIQIDYVRAYEYIPDA